MRKKRYIFSTRASNVVAGDTNGASDATNLLPGVPVGGTHLYLASMHLLEGNHPWLPE